MMRLEFDITDYGAKADRDFNSFDAVKEATARAVAAGGGDVVFPKPDTPRGAYYLNDPDALHFMLHPPAGVRFRGTREAFSVVLFPDSVLKTIEMGRGL